MQDLGKLEMGWTWKRLREVARVRAELRKRREVKRQREVVGRLIVGAEVELRVMAGTRVCRTRNS